MGHRGLPGRLLIARPRLAVPAILAGVAVLAAACGGAASTSGSGGARRRPAAPHAYRHAYRPLVNGGPTTPVTSTTAAPTTSTVAGPGTPATAPPGAATTLPPSAPLVKKQAPTGEYQVQVPTVWSYRNATIPSDHITNVWSDPSVPGESLTVTASGCIGCVEYSLSNPSPDPSRVMPTGGTVKASVDPYTIDYEAPAFATGSVDFGRVDILHRGSVITGYVRLDVVLPSGDSQLAARMLQSFALPSS